MSIQEDLSNHINSIKANNGNIGIMYVGHHLYWPQFPNLKDKLKKHCNYFVNRLKKECQGNFIEHIEICDSYDSSKLAGEYFAGRNLDMIICFITTYTPSAFAAVALQKISHVPVLLLCMQPDKNLDYNKSTTELLLENVNITSLPEIAYAINRTGKKPLDCIVGNLYDDDRAWNKIKDWCEIVNLAHKIKDDHIGYIGHVYEGMLDMNSDPTMFDSFFKMHVEHLEMEDLEKFVDDVKDREIKDKIDEILSLFDFPDPDTDPITQKVEKEDLLWPAKVSVAMDKLVCHFGLTGLAFYYRGTNNNKFERMHAGMIIGNSLLTSKGISVAGELDLKNCVAMLVMNRLSAGGSFAELFPIDFEGDFALVGHDGPHHLIISERKPILRKLSILHGKTGTGPSVEYQIKKGPITMFGLTQTFEGRFKMVLAEGESLPGLIPTIGNTCTRGKFKPDVRTFLENWSKEGPTHHFALGVGHVAGKIEMLAKYLNIESVRITPVK